MKRRSRSQTQEPLWKSEPSHQSLSKKRRAIDNRSGSSAKKKKSRTTSETPSPQPDIGRAMSPLRTPSTVMDHNSYADFSSENTLSVHTTSSALSHSLRSFSQQKQEVTPPRDRARPELARLEVPQALSQELLMGEEPSSHSSPLLRPSPVRKSKPKRPFDAGLSVAVAVAYASFIFCRSFFTITQAQMKDDLSIKLTAIKANEIITACALVFGLAKFPVSMVVTATPPKVALLGFMACTAALVAVAASPFTQSSNALYYISLLNAVPQAGAYPAVTKLVCASFDPDQRADVFALISLGSRAGSVAVSVVMGEVLRRSNDWRVAVQVAPLAVLGAMALVILSGQTKPKSPSSLSSIGGQTLAPLSPMSPCSPSSPRAGSSFDAAAPLGVRLGRLACNPRFWLVNVGSAMLLISKGFETHAVRYISDLCEAAHAASCAPGETCLCKSYAPQVTACLSLGIVASLLLGSFVWGKLTAKAPRAAFIVFLCALNLVAALLFYGATVATLTHGVPPLGPESPEWQTLTGLGVGLFCIGLSAGYPFYMPQSLFAVEFGDRDAATVVGCGECLQSVFAYAFICTAQRYAVKVDESTDWGIIWAAISLSAALGLVFMLVYMKLSLSRQSSSPRKAAVGKS